ncbi:hypothetical protein C4K88_06270 [Arthrobacter pityocampae]|uniref:DUF308 domain-containing protein n=1 Tax=Arthrobacter pityocampae TaxID=547334 RepID=A0A2S5J088_9MICC|nr:hypothetical protein [Arthrobacter pityocampae]PPB50256.1 hypothetical protein C4K88_06270 [Arthrobacter pityocampae]
MGPRGQEPNESTDDAVWLDLVARLEGTSADAGSPVTPRSDDPGSADAPPSRGSGAHDAVRADDPPGDTPGDVTGTTSRERAEAIFRNQPFRSTGPRDYVAPEDPDEDEGFTPEDPPPLGSGDPLTVLAWIGAAGGPVMLFLVAMFWRTAPLAATLGLIAVFLAGAGYLLTKLPKHRDLGDDGAEV